ncbi:MAG: endonuclease III [Patescibacteria group bacterium]
MKNKEERSFANKIFSKLEKVYSGAKCVLKFSNSWELLVAVQLSAQCKDETVNKITEKLFVKYKTLESYANANLREFEEDIKSSGFFRNKAKNIISSAKIVLEKFGGKIPNSMEKILTLPGVARKTANVVLGNAFGIVEGIAVDTHVSRLSTRLGLTKSTSPEKQEKELMEIFDKKNWFNLTYYFIEHGRKICNAKKPKCNECFLKNFCKFYNKEIL